MNKTYRVIYNAALNAWVAASELTRGHTKSRPGGELRIVHGLACAAVAWGCALLSTGAVAAPCAGDAAGAITDGSGLACDITGTSYSQIILGGATSATSIGSVTVTRNAAGSNHAVRAWDSTSLTINGDLTAVRTGATGINAAAQFGAWPGVGGAGSGPHHPTVLVTGNTTISTDNGDALRLIGGSNTFRGNTRVDVLGGAGMAITGAGGGLSGSTNVFSGSLTIQTASSNAALYADTASSYEVGGNLSITTTSTSVGAARPPSGVWLVPGSLTVAGNTQISTQAATAHGIFALGSKVSLQGADNKITTAGANAAGVALAGATQFQSAGVLAVDTKGDGSNGIQLADSSLATLAAVRIATAGTNAAGINVVNTAAQGTTLNLDGPVSIETQGKGSSGIRAVYDTANAVVVPVGSSILTHGELAHGLELTALGPVGDQTTWSVAAGARIEAQGMNANPVYLSSAAGKVSFSNAGELVASGLSISGLRIDGAAGGAEVSNSGAISFNSPIVGTGMAGHDLGGDARIVNTGSILAGPFGGSAGIAMSHSGATGTLTVENQGSVASQGKLAMGLSGVATGAGNVSLINAGTVGTASVPVGTGIWGAVNSPSALLAVSNSGRIDAQSAGISVNSAGGLNITNAGIVTEGAAVALDVSGNVALGGTIDNSGSLLAQSTAVLSQSSGNLSLSNSGTLRAPEAIRATTGSLGATNTASGLIHGTVQAAGGQIDLNNAGLWTNTGNSLLTSLANSGSVTFTAPSGGVYKTITTGNYVGQGGQINLNTWLGDDSSPSDKLVIDGGSATGSTRLGITNTGGAGARTTGNGILVVDAQNGATSTANAFTLAAPVSAGAYDYSLVRRPNESWYLSSDIVTVPPVNPDTPTVPGTPGTAPSVSLPNYRQETSLYAAVPSLAALHSAATMDSFHERLGAAGYAAGEGGQPSRLWVRVLGSNGERRGDAMGIYGRNGPSYDHKTAALQLGGDFYQGRNDNGTRTHAGVYVATGQTTGDVQHFNGTRAGSAKLDVTSLGLYWSVLGEQGGYVDFVAQGSHYGVKATSTRMPTVKTSGSGYDVSVEGGWPFALGGAWTLEPQVQVRLQQAELGSGADLAGRVDYGDVDSLVGRAGLKLGYTSGRIAAWGRLDLLNEFKGRSTTTVSSLAGLYGVGFDSSVHGRSAVLTVGVDAKLTQAVSLYGSASYRRALGDSRGHAWGAQAGVKVAW